MANERWVKVEVVAAHLGVTKASVYRWIDCKAFPVHQIGRLFRFKLSEVDNWVRKSANAKNSREKYSNAVEKTR